MKELVWCFGGLEQNVRRGRERGRVTEKYGNFAHDNDCTISGGVKCDDVDEGNDGLMMAGGGSGGG